jgi:alpha-amylase
MNAITFTMLQDGIPIIYQGQEQHLAGGDTPGQREALWLTGLNTSAPLYQFISKINQFRNTVVSKNSAFVANKIQPVYWDAKTLVTTKGPNSSPVVGVYTNVGMNMAPYTLTLAKSVTGFKKNQQVVEVLSCESLTTDSSGSLALTIKGGMPRVLWSYGSLAGSGICACKSLRISSCSLNNLLNLY